MVTKKDFLTTRNSLLNILNNYTNRQIDEFASSYYFYSSEVFDKITFKTFIKVYRIFNEILKILMKNNLNALYHSNFNASLDEYKLRYVYDELEPLYDELSKPAKKTNKGLVKRFYIKVIKNDFKDFADTIRINRSLRKALSSDEIFYEFSEAFSLFQDMGMNNKEMIDATLCIVSCNIYNGIYDDGLSGIEVEEIKSAHHKIEDSYLKRMESDEEYDISSLLTAFSMLGYPNAHAVNSVLEKVEKKKTIEEEPKATVEPVVEKKKTIEKEPKATVEPVKTNVQPMISKTDYYNGMQIISKYYDIDNGTLKKILKISKIQYVVSIMQTLDFSSSTIETFISRALKKHKSIGALDRYLDLSQKIDYYKEEKDIRRLDEALHELVNEYINASIKDKDFWLSSIVEELNDLENLLNKSYNFELGIKKYQEQS